MNQTDLRVAEDPEERKRHEVRYPYTAPQPSPAVQGDIPDVVDVPDQCPYFARALLVMCGWRDGVPPAQHRRERAMTTDTRLAPTDAEEVEHG